MTCDLSISSSSCFDQQGCRKVTQGNAFSRQDSSAINSRLMANGETFEIKQELTSEFRGQDESILSIVAQYISSNYKEMKIE